ncbi:uncharacterized protein F4822DRAFT_205314 [Hypoxylon trugodes]|uniref:uncharacterized protein n=1 Tax=Hypoxylon trugodes TaxID=326681 RepID=UPI00219C2B78|nr:uncharacterized protein F4822DRAFT_205314 [Hypoxylon trugodes]KAI1389575.1 hypothetical protein F4822DRAFT_205314 [Hypoxylon trugodes]
MSVVYKEPEMVPSDGYSAGVDAGHQDGDSDAPSTRYSPVPQVHDILGYGGADDAVLMPTSPNSPDLGSPNLLGPLTPPESLPSASKTAGHRSVRRRPIPKPHREVTKNREGKFCCTFPGCSEKVKTFTRKCEWSKHMDKHDRPYKCAHPECQKLAGFTYSGGLSRHEREVHGQHGGPVNSIVCPHLSCKRHTHGFTRMENLNEHLRRCHRPNEERDGEDGSDPAGPLPEDEPLPEDGTTLPLPNPLVESRIGEKRKPDTDLGGQVKRLQVENSELRAEIEAQKRQSIAMMQQMSEMTGQLNQLRQIAQIPSSLMPNDPSVPGS